VVAPFDHSTAYGEYEVKIFSAIDPFVVPHVSFITVSDVIARSQSGLQSPTRFIISKLVVNVQPLLSVIVTL